MVRDDLDRFWDPDNWYIGEEFAERGEMGLVCVLVLPSIFPGGSSIYLAWVGLGSIHAVIDSSPGYNFPASLPQSRERVI